MFLISHCLLIYIYEVIHDIYLYFLCYVKSRSYFVLLVFFTHAFMRLLSVSRIYRLIQSCCCLHLQHIDGSQVEFVMLGNIFVMGSFYVILSTLFNLCFVTDCQRGSLLGSKELGTNVLELQCVILANHDQNIQSRFRLLKVWLCVKLESSYCRIYYVNLPNSIDRKSCRLFFLQNFQLSPSPFDMQGFMFCLKYKRENPSHVFQLLFILCV